MRKTLTKRGKFKESWAALGFDVSMSSIAGSAFGYDKTLNEFKGPHEIITRWQKDTHYFDRMKDVAYGHDMVLDLLGMLNYKVELSNVFIAVEEPWSFGHASAGKSAFLKQQAQIHGAFLGSLLRYGYTAIYEIHNTWWRGIIADYLGITIHPSKWGKGPVGKMRAREWAEAKWPDLEKYPDLINSKNGLKPKPNGSKALVRQCDDRYDARAIGFWMRRECIRQLDRA